MSLTESCGERISPQDREVERQAGLAWDLIYVLKTNLPGWLPNRKLGAVAQNTLRVIYMPPGPIITLYPPITGPFFTDTEGNRWYLGASNEGFSLRHWRPLPPISEEPEVSVSDDEFLSAQTRLSHPLFGTVHESWTSHQAGKGLGVRGRGRATDMQHAANDEATALRGRELIGRFAAALRTVPADAVSFTHTRHG